MGGKKGKCETSKRYLMLSAKYLLQSAKADIYDRVQGRYSLQSTKANIYYRVQRQIVITSQSSKPEQSQIRTTEANTYYRGKYVLQSQIRNTEANNVLQKANTYLYCHYY